MLKDLPKYPLPLTDLQVAYVCLHHDDTGFIEVAVQDITADYYNHCSIISKDSDSNLTIVQALGNGVISTPLKTELLNDQVKIIKLKGLYPLQDESALIAKINSFIGDPYYFIGILAQLALKVEKLFDINAWLGGDSKKRFYCSELAAYCIGLPKWWSINPADFDGNDLFDMIYWGTVSDIV